MGMYNSTAIATKVLKFTAGLLQMMVIRPGVREYWN